MGFIVALVALTVRSSGIWYRMLVSHSFLGHGAPKAATAGIYFWMAEGNNAGGLL